MKRSCRVAAVLLFAVFAALVPGEARAQRERQAPHDALWGWLKQSDYRKWNRREKKSTGQENNNSPHGDWSRTYFNQAPNFHEPPNGSVIVKESYNADNKLAAIAVMHRTAGYDPVNGDWYYAQFTPAGRIARTERESLPIAGRFDKCIRCHRGAGGGDSVFFNDAAGSAPTKLGTTIELARSVDFESWVLRSPMPVLVDFYADWCGPCRVQGRILEEFALEANDVRILKVNVDESASLAEKYGVHGLPTLLTFLDGKVVARKIGVAKKEQLRSLLAR